MFKLSEIVKDWKESGALQAHINLYGFWDDETFLTKSGDLGMVLRVKGIDYESLDHASRDHAVKRLEAASRAFDSRVRVYQALLKANEPAILASKREDFLRDLSRRRGRSSPNKEWRRQRSR
jgi:type IV secretion system protein TrbE